MKKYILFGGYLLLLAYITSCDDGRIYEKTETLSEEGRTLKMSGKINGISKWPDGYSVVVAGFSDESEYAVVTKTIPAVEDDEIQGSSAAANLYLTEGKSYEALVNRPSKKVDGMLLVKPGSAQESVLHTLLNTTISSTWGYDHSKEIVSSPILTLIDDWINNGAQE